MRRAVVRLARGPVVGAASLLMIGCGVPPADEPSADVVATPAGHARTPTSVAETAEPAPLQRHPLPDELRALG